MTDPTYRKRPTVKLRSGRLRRWPRRVLITTNVVVALCLIGAASAYGYVHWQLSRIHTEKIGALHQSAGKAFTMLIVGSDTRGLQSGPCDAGGSQANTPGQRSDTIMLARVVPGSRQLSLLSIPRDLWVPISGMGSNRINTAFNSGPNLLVSTIQTALGIPINHYAEVNFDTFCDVTDAVGGVKYYFPTPAKDTMSGLNVPAAGCVNLTGAQALAFVRSRHYEYYQNGEWHYEAASDLARIQRQQSYVKKMIKKATGEFTNPIALNNVISGVTKNLTVDSGLSTSDMINLAETFRSVNAGGIPTQTLPTTPAVINGNDVLNLQQPQAAQMIAAFNTLGTTPATSSTTGAGTPAATSKPPATTIPPSSISVEVVNGSGASGQAAQAQSALQQLGYHASVNSSIQNYSYGTTTINYAPDSAAAAKQLQAQIGGGATLTEDSSLTTSPYNLELITGKSYTGITGGSAASSSTTPATSATTAPAGSSTTTPANQPVSGYVLPGTPAGQQPPADC